MSPELLDFIWKLLFFVVTGVLGSICTFMGKQLKNYKSLLKEKDDEHIIKIVDDRLNTKLEPIIESIDALKNVDNRIDEHLGPIHAEIAELQKEIACALEDEEQLRIQLVGSYRYRLIQLCKRYIRQGYILQEQYDQLSEFFRMYELLGGNGQAKEYYEKAINLEMVTKIDPATNRPIE